jgi:23S rRNA (cytosine1962-C5)-methyltransferase
MGDEKIQMFRNRLTKNIRHLSKLAKKQLVTCYRVYDHDLPEFPLVIERYENKICLAEYKRHHHLSEEQHQVWLQACVDTIGEIMQVSESNIYLRQRQRKEGRQGQYEKRSTEEVFFLVHEGGLRFQVNLTDYLDTGLFLDHRLTRGMVRAESTGKRVLNLFCYTGSFSVYAAAGNAASVDSVDLSKTYLAWAQDNMELNGLDCGQRNHFIHADVKQWLDQRTGPAFDLVIMDPPTFSNSKRMKDFLDIQRDHAELINQALQAMNSGGVLYFSCNYRKFQLNREAIAPCVIKDITASTTPFDFQGKLTRCCYRIVNP